MHRALQSDFNVVVRVPRKEQASPQIVLTGTDADIAKATAKIKELVGIDVCRLCEDCRVVEG